MDGTASLVYDEGRHLFEYTDAHNSPLGAHHECYVSRNHNKGLGEKNEIDSIDTQAAMRLHRRRTRCFVCRDNSGGNNDGSSTGF
jgi:hypothetical protein